MSRVKHTKNELKAQREALRRFERFLPMLQLKKMQLQVELHGVAAQIEAREEETRKRLADLQRWAKLFSAPVDLQGLTRIRDVAQAENNIAGVPIPVLRGLEFERAALDLAATPAWLDDAAGALEALIRLRVEVAFLREQHRRLAEELRTTSQRVNLFEKVKIPEARENIRVIKIFLGDEQTAGVARAKFAKGRTAEFEESGALHAEEAEVEVQP
jgi:V/A-type H+-transporting ATPase subunit D